MNFRDDVPMSNRLAILASQIRLKKREIELEEQKSINILKNIGELETELAILENQYEELIESGKTRSGGG